MHIRKRCLIDDEKKARPQLRLRALTVRDETQARQGHRELALEDFDFLLDLRPDDRWPDYLARLDRQRRGLDLPAGFVPATYLIAESQGDVVGRVSIRHELNEVLAEVGGHIGYGVRPTFRRRGYATQMLRQALEIAHSIGIERVLVTCDGDNVASAATIERCGGVTDETAPRTHSPEHSRRYWIETHAPAGQAGWRRATTVFLASQTISLFGSMLVQCAIMWHLTLTTRSGSVMALAAVFGFLPQAVVSVFGGVWADRLNRKMLIIGADAMIATATLALALLMLAGADDLWLIYVALVIRSVGAGIQMPAVSALLPQIVPTDKLLRVNGINSTIQSGMMLIAPAAAAAVYASTSIIAVFFIDVVTAVIGIALLSLLAVPRLARDDAATDVGAGYFSDLVSGLRYATSHAFVRWLLALYSIVFLLIVSPSYLTPLMIVRTFGPEVWKLTGNEIAFSVGMIIGGALLATWGGVKNRVAMIVGATLALAALSVALGLSTQLFVFFGFQLLVGLTVPLFATTSMTALQETVEPQMQGRVFGLVGIVTAIAMPIGIGVSGPLADRFTVQSVLVATGVVMLLVVATAAILPSGRRTMATASEHARGQVSQ